MVFILHMLVPRHGTTTLHYPPRRVGTRPHPPRTHMFRVYGVALNFTPPPNAHRQQGTDTHNDTALSLIPSAQPTRAAHRNNKTAGLNTRSPVHPSNPATQTGHNKQHTTQTGHNKQTTTQTTTYRASGTTRIHMQINPKIPHQNIPYRKQTI